MLAPEAKVPVSRTNVEVVLAGIEIESLIFPYVGWIKICQVINGVIVDTPAQLPFDLSVERSLRAKLGPSQHVRPMTRTGVCPRDFSLNESPQTERGAAFLAPWVQVVSKQGVARGRPGRLRQCIGGPHRARASCRAAGDLRGSIGKRRCRTKS